MGTALNSVAIALHLLGVILWIGGTATAALIVAFAADSARREVAVAARRAVVLVATPGLLLAWVAGLSVLVPSFTTSYARAGWMHGKLTVALILTGLTGYLTGRMRKGASGQVELRPGALRGGAIGILALAAIVVGLVILRPGG